MKNWEKYEKEIREIAVETVAVDKSTLKPEACGKIDCYDCLFDKACATDDFMMRTNWLYSDYKEPVVLTNDERKLCELLGKGWIARDDDDTLSYYTGKPFKTEGKYYWVQKGAILAVGIFFPQCKFEFIKWEDEEPWEVKV